MLIAGAMLLSPLISYIVLTLVFIVYYIIAFFIITPLFFSQPNEAEQIRNLEKDANRQVSSIIKNNEYTIRNLDLPKCREVNTDGGKRYCDFNFRLDPKLSKDKMTELIINDGYQKKFTDIATKNEQYYYNKKQENCVISDLESADPYKESMGNLHKTVDYYTFHCTNETHDTSLKNLLKDID